MTEFAKLFATPHGQLLVFLDETEEGDPAITVKGAPVRGVNPTAKMSGWTDGEAGQLRNFSKIDQEHADMLAQQLFASADSLAPRDAA